MTILITGGCGLIGVGLTRGLLDRGEAPVVFDIAPEERLPKDLRGRITYIRGDITNWAEVLNAVKDHGIRELFHLAGLLSAPSEANPWRSYSVNVEGTFYVMEAARLFGVNKVVFSSSMGVYGITDDEIITDATAQVPPIMYGVTKVCDDLLGRYYHRRFGIDFRGIRLPQVIGPGVRSGGFGQYNPGMIEAAALGKPYEVWVPEETALPIIYIKDALRGLLELYDADASRIKTRIYNLGQITPPPTAKGLADIVRRFVPGAEITFKPDPAAIEAVRVISKRIDGTNAEKEWDWKIGYSAEETVKDFLVEMKLAEKS